MKILISVGLLFFGLILGADASERVIYLSPSGSDKADGLSVITPLRTLQAAVDKAVKDSDGPYEQMRVSVGQGEYRAQNVITKGSSNGKPIVIMAEGGTADRPRFVGVGEGGTWFTLKSATGKPSRITITGLEISNYVTAISFNGERTSENASNGENIIRDNIFKNIGQIAYPAGKPSTAVIRLVNSDNNTIMQNRFENIRNITSCSGLHSIYIAHYSTDNLITDNVFDGGCGPAIKVRDASDRNTVRHNSFVAQETNATLVDSYCNQDVSDDCTKAGPECPSWDNIYEDNLVEMEKASHDLKPVRIKKGTAPVGCPEPASNKLQVKEIGTRIVW